MFPKPKKLKNEIKRLQEEVASLREKLAEQYKLTCPTNDYTVVITRRCRHCGLFFNGESCRCSKKSIIVGWGSLSQDKQDGDYMANNNGIAYGTGRSL